MFLTVEGAQFNFFELNYKYTLTQICEVGDKVRRLTPCFIVKSINLLFSLATQQEAEHKI